MKKVLVTLLLALSVFAGTAKAQLTPGHYAMDFTLTPLNNGGTPVHLYEWLDAGKYVILDFSATWCSWCWRLHQAGILEYLQANHGPGTATDDLRVLFVEGDASTPDAKMSGGDQGDWLTGTNYPMCNPSAEDVAVIQNAYKFNSFPTLYIVCPNRSVIELTSDHYIKQVTSSSVVYYTGEEVYDYIKSLTCPALIQYENTFSNFALMPTISFNNTFGADVEVFNSGAKDLDSFTVVLKGDNQIYSSVVSTTKLAPFQTSESISISSDQFPAGTSYMSIELIPHTNVDTVVSRSVFKIASYSDATKYTFPFTENFEDKDGFPALFGLTPVLANYMFSVVDAIQFQNGSVPVVGPDGDQTKALMIPFYNLNTDQANWVGVMTIGNFDAMTAVDTIKFEFDYTYRMYPGQTTDKLEVVYSTDQGATWKTSWSKAGSYLATIDTSSNYFVPSDASQWKHITTLVKVAGKENVLLGLRATSGYGNNCYVDNLKLYGVRMTPVNEPETVQVGVFPNPAKEYFTVQGYNGTAKLFDVTGRLVWSGNVTDGEQINIETLVPGVYYINLSGNIQKFVKQ